MTTSLVDRLRDAVEGASGSSVTRMTAVHGGDTAAAYRVDLADDRRLFAKTHPDPPPGFFTTEAASLAWIGSADAVAVPEVIAVADDGPAFLVLGWIDETRGAGTSEGETALGQALAHLHLAGAPCFGREDRRTTGSRGLPNEPADRWATHYAQNRLLPLARLARDCRALPPNAIEGLERIASSLERFDDGEPPARLHGDLWAGNRIVDTAGCSWLIDPASHGGHREFDLAMMRLFGGFESSCFDGYEMVHPLAAGWQDRVLLHQLAPLVIHAIKFGGSYVAASVDAIGRY